MNKADTTAAREVVSQLVLNHDSWFKATGRSVLAKRFVVAAAHVDRDRPQLLGFVVAELVEEPLQHCGSATVAGPHDRAVGVVGDEGEVPPAAAVGDLADADHLQVGEATAMQLAGDHAANDRGDRPLPDPHEATDHAERGLLGVRVWTPRGYEQAEVRVFLSSTPAAQPSDYRILSAGRFGLSPAGRRSRDPRSCGVIACLRSE